MKKNILPLLVVLTVSSFANASGIPWETEGWRGMSNSSMTGTLFTSVSPSYTTEKLHKEIVEAKEDISYFVASEGEVRTARFESALTWVKQNFAVGSASDLEIAQALLNDLK